MRSRRGSLVLETSATNVFLGQPFQRARDAAGGSAANEIEALREIQFNGDGLMTDKTAFRQSIEAVNINGQLKPAFVCEMTVTPIATGPLKFSAQGFTAGREFSGPISIRGQVNLPGGPAKYVLLVSDPVEINVRPLPAEGELPGFTGAIGKFFRDPPQLATNRLRVGEPVQLKIVFHGEGDLTRFVPPAPPRSRDWQIIADPPPATGFTLIPLTDEMHETPAIPFSYFDPATAKYVDLTIPPLPVTVVGEGLPVQLPAFDDEDEIRRAAEIERSRADARQNGGEPETVAIARLVCGRAAFARCSAFSRCGNGTAAAVFWKRIRTLSAVARRAARCAAKNGNCKKPLPPAMRPLLFNTRRTR